MLVVCNFLASLGIVYVHRFQKLSLLQHALLWLWLIYTQLCNVDPFWESYQTISFLCLLSEMMPFELIDLKQNNVENGKCDEKSIFNAYENYHIMVDIIKKFSDVFAAYFFYSEFTLQWNCWHGAGLR